MSITGVLQGAFTSYLEPYSKHDILNYTYIEKYCNSWVSHEDTKLALLGRVSSLIHHSN